MQEQQKLLKIDEKITFECYLNQKKSTIHMDRNELKVENSTIVLKVYDMIGLIKKQASSQGYLKYSLFSYPRRKKIFKQEQRYVEEFLIQIRDVDSWNNDNIEERIISLICNRNQQQSKKLLICFNPNAGSNSLKYLNKILSFIKHTNLTAEVFRTNHRNHCLEHLKTINHNQYCGIAIVSGDGLMHEYVNSFCPIPVTHVPAGSGNAFAKTQMTQAGQLCKAEESIFLVIKNRRKMFNIVKYQLEKIKDPIYSFLSLQWAFIADLDMNSQFLRCIGGLRYQVYAVWLLIKLKRYRARLTYSTIQKQMPGFQTDLQNNPNYMKIQQNFLHSIFCSIPYISDKYLIAPLLNLEDKLIDMQVIKDDVGRFQMAKYLLSSQSGGHFNKESYKPAEGFNFQHRLICSFRLEPLDQNMLGIFGIDGEAYEAQKIQASFCDKGFLAFV